MKKKKSPGKSTRAFLRHIKWEHNHRLNLLPSKERYILEAPFQMPRWQGLGEFRVIPIEIISSRRSRVQKRGVHHKQSGQCERMWVACFEGLGGPVSRYQCKYKRKTSPGANVVTQKWSHRQWKGQETKSATVWAVERPLDLQPAGIWVSDQGFWSLTPTLFPSDSFQAKNYSGRVKGIFLICELLLLTQASEWRLFITSLRRHPYGM